MPYVGSVTDDARPRVFISYGPEDAAVGAFIERAINTRYDVHPNHTWSDASLFSMLIETITADDFIIVLLSRAGLRSGLTAKESEFLAVEAKRRGADLVPVLLEACEPPPTLSELEVVDLSIDGALGVQRIMQRLRGQRIIDFKQLDAQTFERLVIELLRKEGFDVQIEARGRDLGRDALAVKNDQTWYVEIVHTLNGRVPLERLDRISKQAERRDRVAHAIVVTSGHLTSIALSRLYLEGRSDGAKIEILDGTALRRRLAKYPDMVDYFFGAGE